MDDQQNQNQEIRYKTPFNIDVEKIPRDDFNLYVNTVMQLSQDFKNLLTEFSTAEFIHDNLGPQFQLSQNQKEEVTRIIRDLILAKLSFGNMVAVFQEKLNVDQQKSRNLINYIFTNLLSKETLEELKSMHMKKFGQTLPSSPLQPIQQPQPIQSQKIEIKNPNVLNLRDKGE